MHLEFNYIQRNNFCYSKNFEMVQTSLFERMKIINLFNLLELGCRNKYKVVSELKRFIRLNRVNRLKRFIYMSMAKRFGEKYDDAIFVDECTV